jgi:hypothetical protein
MRRSSVPAWTRTILGSVGNGRQHTCATGQRQRRVVCRFTTGTNDRSCRVPFYNHQSCRIGFHVRSGLNRSIFMN